MSFKYLNLSGLEDLWINIKNYILSKVPTKTSELTNDSGYLTSHQSLDNYVTLNTTQTITAIKVITGGNQGKMLFKNPNYTKGDAVESGATISRIYFGNGTSYATANGVLTTDINSAGNTYMELCAMNNTASNSNRASLILTYDKSATRPRLLKSWGDFIPYSDNNYTLGNTSNIWKECYSNAYYLGTTAFGDIVTHNASEFLTEHPTITLSSNTTSTASPTHGGTFTCIDSVTQDTNGHITKVNTKTITLPSDNNTDTKVTQTVTTGNSAYPVLLCATANATETETTTSRFSEGLTVNTRYSSISMTNKYDSANTKGVRDSTKGYLNGDIIFRCYDASEMGRIHCESSKNGYQQTYMQARSYIKNGAISPEGTATTCYITVRVRDNGSKTIYTDGSWENSLTPYINETYDLGTSSLRWMRCYCKNFYGSYVDIAGRYLENEYSTNARTCLYLKSNRDTDGQSGIYFSKFRQNRAQGSLTGSDLVDLSLDVLENSVRTNSCISISFRYFENNVPTKIYFIPKKSMTSYMGTEANPWTNAYITNLNLNGSAFDPTSTDGIGTTRLLAYEPTSTSGYGSNPAGTTKPGSSLYDVSMRLHNATGYYGDFNSGSGEFSITVNARSTQSGTWKVLHSFSIEVPQNGTRSFAIGMWVRIA